MDNDTIIFVITIILFITICLTLYSFVYKYMKMRRILDFSLEEKDGKTYLERIFFNFSDFLGSLVIFNSYSRIYDKFVYDEGRMRKGIDFVSLKILIGIGIVLFYSLGSFLYFNYFNIALFVILFLLGYISVDFYCIYHFGKRNTIDRGMLLQAIIIMHNGFKAGKSINDVLNDVIKESKPVLAKQFRNILSDYKIGFSLSEAFRRFYVKYNDSRIKYISDRLKLYDEGVSLIDIFEDIEKGLIINEKMEKKLDDIKSFNLLLSLIIALMPGIIISIIIFVNKDIANIIISEYGFAVILMEMIMYLLYLFFVKLILKGRYL